MADYAKDVLVDTAVGRGPPRRRLRSGSSRSTRTPPSTPRPTSRARSASTGRRTSRTRSSATSSGPRSSASCSASRGISNDHTIVLYGDRNNWFAAYTYWYLKYYGHDDVKLMNGPREKWIAEGRPTTTDVPALPARDVHGAARRRRRSARKRDEVLAALGTDTRLVDVRSPQEFSGELIAMAGYEQEGAQRAGHIPGAASVPWAQAVKRGRHLQVGRRAEELYSGKGVLDGDADHRLLPHRRALGAHVVRAARAARPATTSRTTTARGPSGATWSTCRSRSDV